MALSGKFVEEKTAWVADQLKKIDEAGTTEVTDIKGIPIAVFTIKGAKSGLLRRVPLMRVEHNGSYAAVASKGGAPEHPAWYHNIQANPDVDVQDGAVIIEAKARELEGAEREEWWKRAVEVFPDYAEYQQKTDRKIPIFLLEPK